MSATGYFIRHPDDPGSDFLFEKWALHPRDAVAARRYAVAATIAHLARNSPQPDYRDFGAEMLDTELFWGTNDYLDAVRLLSEGAPSIPATTREHPATKPLLECVILPEGSARPYVDDAVLLAYFLRDDGDFLATVVRSDGAVDAVTIDDRDPDSLALLRLMDWILHNPDLMQKTAIDIAPRPSKKARRRGAIHEPSPVTIIDLRASHRAARADVARAESTYRSRWIVRGHWHRYWTGPRDDRKLEPRYVMPYVKGPDGAPLNETTRVNVW